MTNEEKAMEISLQWWSDCGWQLQAAAYDSAIEAMAWKDEEYKLREDGLRETIDALDARLRNANESGMYYFNKCNVQKQRAVDWLTKYLFYLDNKDDIIDNFKKSIEGE